MDRSQDSQQPVNEHCQSPTNSIDSSKASLACLIAAFGMLWIPLGQHEFLIRNWMKVGTLMAPFLVFVALTFRATNANRVSPDLSVISLGLLIAYIAHQFEEHWIDLFGNRYAFKPYVNQMLLDRLGGEERAVGPLSDEGVFVINTSLVWLVGALAIWQSHRHVFPTLCMAAIVLVNAFGHLVVATVDRAYNPGLLTSALVFLPHSLAVYIWLIRSGVAEPRLAIASLAWGILAHVAMVLGMIASGWLGIIPETAYFALLIGWSILPVLLFRSADEIHLATTDEPIH
ncbi:MAG: HXXEE domain-containing protein [Planctomycetota bacterium]